MVEMILKATHGMTWRILNFYRVKTMFGIGKEIAQPIEAIGNAIDKIFTNDEERAGAKASLAKIGMQPQILQIELNKIESGHRSVFVAGWRPAVGWMCVFGLGWHFVGYPIASFLLTIVAPDIIPPALASAKDLLSLVVALLGLGAYRTFEKTNGKAK